MVRYRSWAGVVLFLALSLCLSPGTSYAVPIPIVTAGSAIVHVGDIFTIPISITAATELTSWQFDLSFNPTTTILQANAVTEGPFLSSSGTKTTLFSPGAIDNGSTPEISLVTDSYVDLPPGPSGNGVLANIEFKALAVGQSPLTLSNVCLTNQGTLSCNSGTDFLVVNGLVTVIPQVVPVPEPSTVALLSVGLAAWSLYRGALRGRRQRVAQALPPR